MKQQQKREWLWCSDCKKAKEQEKKHSCPWCYLRFPEEEALWEMNKKKQS